MIRKIYTDHHVHTCYSPDSNASIEKYLTYAKELGFSNIMFTDHIDMGAIEVEFQEHIDYKEYKEIIDLILKTIIKKSKGIEVNTSGLRTSLKTTFPKKKLLIRYKKLGGKIITLGSDAHTNEDYNKGILDGIKNLKSLGFNEITSFNKRKATQNKIIV